MSAQEETSRFVAPVARRVAGLRNAVSRRRNRWLYNDDVVRMDTDGIVIRHYYWPLGRKRIPYPDIENFNPRPLKAWHGQHRVHGIDRRGRWYSRDSHRGEKELAIDLDIGKRIRPVLTPDEPDTFIEILEVQMGRSDASEESPTNGPPEEDSPETWLM